jgi:Uma2 family endonuclease
MSVTVATPLMTTEQLLAMPDDGVERWLIDGQLKERPMTLRNRYHSHIVIRIGSFIDQWIDRQPPPRGEVFGGEAGCRLRRDPDTSFGIDVVYVGPETAARQPGDTTLVDGVPVLAVEVLSPSTPEEDTNEKIDAYLAAGVPWVWIVDPHLKTVTVLRPDVEPELFNVRQELTCEPHMPGFRVAVARIFERS